VGPLGLEAGRAFQEPGCHRWSAFQLLSLIMTCLRSSGSFFGLWGRGCLSPPRCGGGACLMGWVFRDMASPSVALGASHSTTPVDARKPDSTPNPHPTFRARVHRSRVRLLNGIQVAPNRPLRVRTGIVRVVPSRIWQCRAAICRLVGGLLARRKFPIEACDR
jgi:hypothetical protein